LYQQYGFRTVHRFDAMVWDQAQPTHPRNGTTDIRISAAV
jgi:hypothetical protein